MQPAFIFFFCTDNEDGKDSVYIGESESLCNRLRQHILDRKNGKENFYWETVVAFSAGKELTKTSVRYLEARCVEIANTSIRYKVLTQKKAKSMPISEQEKASMDEFLEYMKTLLVALGYRVLEPVEIPRQLSNSNRDDSNILLFEMKEARGTGFLTMDNKFVLQAGSKLSKDTVKSCPETAIKIRKKLEEEGKISNLTLVEDVVFNSSSLAGAFLLGGSISGPQHWKTSDGTCLKDL